MAGRAPNAYGRISRSRSRCTTTGTLGRASGARAHQAQETEMDKPIAPAADAGASAVACGDSRGMANIMWTNVIFALATLVNLAILDYNFKKDRNKLLYALGGIVLVASVACFILTSIDLAQLKAPRAISPDQRNRIAEKMKQFAGQQYTGLIGSGVADAGDLWREIGLSLDSAGWQFWCCIPKTIVRLSAHEVSITPVAPEGILIL
jgi:hypothetical protein